MKLLGIVAAAFLALAAVPAVADDLQYDSDLAKALGISEIRAGVMMDDVELYSRVPIWFVPQPDTFHTENIDTISGDVVFNTPDLSGFLAKPDIGWFNWLINPRPVVGFDLNFKHESVIHASLNWHIPIGDTGIFIEPEVGGSLNNAVLDATKRPPGWRDVGCNALIYWSLNIGYQINEHWNIMATEQHSSHDGLCEWVHNQGINYEGIRIGYKF